MAGHKELDLILAPVVAWAQSRADVLGLALAGSWARGAARPDSDIDLILLVSEPQWFRDRNWLAEIRWAGRRVTGWHDVDYGAAWSRHAQLEPSDEVEFTFCHASWTAIDPVDPGTADVVSNGCRILLDKRRLFDRLLAAATP